MHPLENLATPINDTASGTGSANAAHLDLGPIRKDVDIATNATGTADVLLTLDVSQDNSTWRLADTVTYSDPANSTPAFEQYDLAYPHVRAYLNASHDLVELASKGID